MMCRFIRIFLCVSVSCFDRKNDEWVFCSFADITERDGMSAWAHNDLMASGLLGEVAFICLF